MAFWDRTKTNRLKLPKTFKRVERVHGDESHTWCGQSIPVVGDFVHCGSGVSAGTVGRVVDTKTFKMPHEMISLHVETLDGKINKGWAIGATVIPLSAVNEVKDFYFADGRPERIKVTW